MSAEPHEKTPGVYVRAGNELPHELDMLWSHTRSDQREERSPLIPFVAGAVVGAVVTAAILMLFVMKPEVSLTGDTDILTPIAETIEAESVPIPAVTGPSKTGSVKSATGSLSKDMRSYTVVSGDTLGGIAYKVYGSSEPKYIDKIQRANNMKSPDSLQINQKLVIPPKDY